MDSAPAPDRLAALLKPRNIALIGASERAPHAAALMRNLFRFGFPKDRIYPVNPRYEQLFDLRCYPSVGAVPGDVDLAVIAIPRDGTVQVMEECAAKGVRAVLTVATGFGEFDDTGRKYQAELARIVRDHGIALAGPQHPGLSGARKRRRAVVFAAPRASHHRTGERGVQQRRHCSIFSSTPPPTAAWGFATPSPRAIRWARASPITCGRRWTTTAPGSSSPSSSP